MYSDRITKKGRGDTNIFCHTSKKSHLPVINPLPLLSNMMNVATKTNKLKES
jgi:hypothetical protein